MKLKIVIFGCGGHARSVADVILTHKSYSILCFVDDNALDNETIYGFGVKKRITLNHSEICIVAIGDNAKRKRVFESIDWRHLVSVISDFACVSELSTIHHGAFIGNACHIGPEAVIGENTIINTASIIEHEVTIGNHCHIAPNVTICGKTSVGDLSFIGAGAVVIPEISICANSVIGAGSVVTKDIKHPGVYAGRPARKVK
jgi:UDP-N-acetylbacillosamine N-acetyltransferase